MDTATAKLRYILFWSVIISSFSLSMLANATTPSCEGQETSNEKILCTDEQLIKMVTTLESMSNLLSLEKDDLLIYEREQLEWKKYILSTCLSKQCLVEGYNNRIASLQKKISKSEIIAHSNVIQEPVNPKPDNFGEDTLGISHFQDKKPVNGESQNTGHSQLVVDVAVNTPDAVDNGKLQEGIASTAKKAALPIIIVLILALLLSWVFLKTTKWMLGKIKIGSEKLNQFSNNKLVNNLYSKREIGMFAASSVAVNAHCKARGGNMDTDSVKIEKIVLRLVKFRLETDVKWTASIGKVNKTALAIKQGTLANAYQKASGNEKVMIGAAAMFSDLEEQVTEFFEHSGTYELTFQSEWLIGSNTHKDPQHSKISHNLPSIYKDVCERIVSGEINVNDDFSKYKIIFEPLPIADITKTMKGDIAKVFIKEVTSLLSKKHKKLKDIEINFSTNPVEFKEVIIPLFYVTSSVRGKNFASLHDHLDPAILIFKS